MREPSEKVESEELLDSYNLIEWNVCPTDVAMAVHFEGVRGDVQIQITTAPEYKPNNLQREQIAMIRLRTAEEKTRRRERLKETEEVPVELGVPQIDF